MSGITREEFSKIYKEQFLPIIGPLEAERVEVTKKAGPSLVLAIVFIIVFISGLVSEKVLLVVLGLGVAVPSIIYAVILLNKIREKLKKQVITSFYQLDQFVQIKKIITQTFI